MDVAPAPQTTAVKAILIVFPKEIISRVSVANRLITFPQPESAGCESPVSRLRSLVRNKLEVAFIDFCWEQQVNI